ncbi:MAG: hypothetical protein MMC33_004931 [Icmadophila ericetorum]|nr:hypothetical protein [Icmadophila ericetorum]
MAPRRLIRTEVLQKQPVFSRIVVEMLPRESPSPSSSESPTFTLPMIISSLPVNAVMSGTQAIPGGMIAVVVVFSSLVVAGFILATCYQSRKKGLSAQNLLLSSSPVSPSEFEPPITACGRSISKPLPPTPTWEDDFQRKPAKENTSPHKTRELPAIKVTTDTPSTVSSPFLPLGFVDVDLEHGDRITPLPSGLPLRSRAVSSNLSQMISERLTVSPTTSSDSSRRSSSEAESPLWPVSANDLMRGALRTRFASLRRKKAIKSQLLESVIYHDVAHDAKLDLLKEVYFHAVDRHKEKTDLAGEVYEMVSSSRSGATSRISSRESAPPVRNQSETTLSAESTRGLSSSLAVIEESKGSMSQDPTHLTCIPTFGSTYNTNSATTCAGGLRLSAANREWHTYEQAIYARQATIRDPEFEKVLLPSANYSPPTSPEKEEVCRSKSLSDTHKGEIAKKIDFWRQQGELGPRSGMSIVVVKPVPIAIQNKRKKFKGAAPAFWIPPAKGLEMLNLRTYDKTNKQFSWRGLPPGPPMEELPGLELMRASKDLDGVWKLPETSPTRTGSISRTGSLSGRMHERDMTDNGWSWVSHTVSVKASEPPTALALPKPSTGTESIAADQDGKRQLDSGYLQREKKTRLLDPSPLGEEGSIPNSQIPEAALSFHGPRQSAKLLDTRFPFHNSQPSTKRVREERVLYRASRKARNSSSSSWLSSPKTSVEVPAQEPPIELVLPGMIAAEKQRNRERKRSHAAGTRPRASTIPIKTIPIKKPPRLQISTLPSKQPPAPQTSQLQRPLPKRVSSLKSPDSAWTSSSPKSSSTNGGWIPLTPFTLPLSPMTPSYKTPSTLAPLVEGTLSFPPDSSESFRACGASGDIELEILMPTRYVLPLRKPRKDRWRKEGG